MNPRILFPLGKAHGVAFCNRNVETEWLAKNIQAGKHSLLIAPRRFGKSSLAERAVEITGLPSTLLNFNTCSDEQDVDKLIRQGVGHLINKAVGPAEKIIGSIKKYVKNLSPKITVSTDYAELELAVSEQKIESTPSNNVIDALTLIEKLLIEKNKHAVIIFDEFQTVGLIAKGRGIEAAIRNVAQDMKNLSIIFSGSNRTLLKSMFEDEKRPLFKLCRKLYLKRIEAEHYQKHLNHASQLTWKKDLKAEVFETIMFLSERHPYYLNYLCDVLWTESSASPNKNDVDHAWNTVIDEEKSDANAEIANISLGQKKILKHIANYSSIDLMSAGTVKITGMALSSTKGALKVLLEKDILEKEDNKYMILNPIIKYVLQKNVIN